MTEDLNILKQELLKREAYLLGNFRVSSDKLVEDPAHYFEWCDKDFELAGDLVVVQRMLNAIINVPDVTKEKLIAVCTKHVIDSAKYPKHSTSQSSNLIEQFILAAYARMVETITYS